MQPAGWFMTGALHGSLCAVMAELGCFMLERHWQRAGLRKEGALGVRSEKPKLAFGTGPLHHPGSVERPGSGSQWSEFGEVIGTRLPG